MGKRVTTQTERTTGELHERYRQAHEAVERTHWHILWQAKEGKTPQEIASMLGYTARWVRTVIGKWNAEGEEGNRQCSSIVLCQTPQPAPQTDSILRASAKLCLSPSVKSSFCSQKKQERCKIPEGWRPFR